MKKLVMFTDGFPWAPGEIPFIKNELEALAKEFDVEIVARVKSQYKDKDPLIELPSNVKLHKYIIEDVTRKEKLQSLGYVLRKSAFYKEIIRLIRVDRRKCVMSEMYSYITTVNLFMRWLDAHIDMGNVDIFYTYWNSYATLGLALKKKNDSKYKLVTRTHRYDLFNERTIYYRQYFKEYVDKKLDKVFFIAEQGKDYYMKNFAHSADDKYVVNMIGVTKAESIPKPEKSDYITMVSCSNVIAVKRVHMIAEALSEIEDIRIKWVHMGAGILFEELKELCSATLDEKNNIEYELKGRIPNTEVRDYYENNYVDFFITTSASEGSPVSIQEAMAYGIPIVGTTVGEVAVLAKENGVVLCEDPSIEQVKEAIQRMCTLSDEEKEQMRRKAYAKWENTYDVKKNSKEFVEILKSM